MKRAEIIEKKMEHGISNPMCPRLLSLKAAANYLGLTVWGMRERIWSGQIPVVRFPGGRKMFFDRFDLDQLIDKHKTTMI